MKIRLTECDEPFLGAGIVFTFTGEYPFDKEPVDFMLCQYLAGKADRSDFAFYCVSGYHAGSLEYVLPKEAQAENVKAISTQWLKDNWKSKVYGGCEACDVMLSNWIWDQQERSADGGKTLTVTDEMTVSKFIDLMYEQYGDEFNWQWISPEKFVDELKTELGPDDPFAADKQVFAAAKCDSCDDMLFWSLDADGNTQWRIYHLTFSHCREKEGFPRRTALPSRKAALEYIRDKFIEDYL